MTPAARERQRVRVPLLVASAVAWVALVAQATTAPSMQDMADPSMGPAPGAVDLGPSVLGGALMVVAMMVPLLGPPIGHVLASSLARRRARSVAEFLLGYLGPWVVVGACLMALPALLGTGPGPTVAAALIVAAIWQFSPAKQRCLNRLHGHPALPAFGPSADRAALRFGLTHAGWCIGACWSLMALAVVVPGWSLLAMALVTAWLAAERLERPELPTWRLRVPGRALRLVLAQIEIGVRGHSGPRGREPRPSPAAELA
jgi:predicted metal-binding membrane protein